MLAVPAMLHVCDVSWFIKNNQTVWTSLAHQSPSHIIVLHHRFMSMFNECRAPQNHLNGLIDNLYTHYQSRISTSWVVHRLYYLLYNKNPYQLHEALLKLSIYFMILTNEWTKNIWANTASQVHSQVPDYL